MRCRSGLYGFNNRCDNIRDWADNSFDYSLLNDTHCDIAADTDRDTVRDTVRDIASDIEVHNNIFGGSRRVSGTADY